MKYVVTETYEETRHIVLELPENSTEEVVKEAAFGSTSDEWESDKYDTMDFKITDEEGTLLELS